MVCLYIHLVNYAGLYNGMGLNEINIDFTKCKHKIILIKGDNGSGKSTILESISPLPEENGYFIPGMAARKDIGYFDEVSGIRYDISYIHEVKNDGSRATAKGYIKKTLVEGGTIEMNPTGNITPCKDLVYSEFDLDPSFVALTKMNTTDKGLVSKTPAERKRYVNNILSATQAYNDMHKVISKKATLFKDQMKRLASKIDSIGNPEKLSIDYNSACSLMEQLSARLEEINRRMIRAEETMSSIDASGDVSSRYSEIKDRLEEISGQLASLTSTIPKNSDTPEKVETKINILNATIADLNKRDTELAVRTEALIKDQEYNGAKFMEKTQTLNSFTDSATIKDLKDSILDIDRQIHNTENELRLMGIDPNTTLESKDFAIVFDILNRIDTMLHRTYDPEVLRYILVSQVYIYNAQDIRMTYYSYLAKLMAKTEKEYRPLDRYSIPMGRVPGKVPNNYLPREASLAEKKLIYNDYLTLVEKSKRLSMRPANCESSKCPFIKDSIEASKKIEALPFTPEEFATEMEAWAEVDTELQTIKKANAILEPLSREIYSIFMTVINNREIFTEASALLKLEPLTSAKSLVRLIESIDKGFIKLEDNRLYQAFNEKDNLFLTRDSLMKQRATFEKQIAELTAKNQLIEVLSHDIEELDAKLRSDVEEIGKYNSERSDITNRLKMLSSELEKQISLRSIYVRISELTKEQTDLTKEKTQIEEQAVRYDKAKTYHAECVNAKTITTQQIKDTELHKSELQYNLRQIDQYQKELKILNDRYYKVDLVKRYSSPTSAGIQIVYSKMYMNDITIHANQILHTLFDGTLSLKEFVINETEFRLPLAVSNGIDHDDVKSLSGAQSVLVSLIISFALVRKSSSKLDILTADELDGPLDPKLRRDFIHIMDVVGSKQSILISHNSEMNLSDCDIVLLKNENGDGPNINGNVIWSYYNIQGI